MCVCVCVFVCVCVYVRVCSYIFVCAYVCVLYNTALASTTFLGLLLTPLNETEGTFAHLCIGHHTFWEYTQWFEGRGIDRDKQERVLIMEDSTEDWEEPQVAGFGVAASHCKVGAAMQKGRPRVQGWARDRGHMYRNRD
jgi:hypothetical protein